MNQKIIEAYNKLNKENPKQLGWIDMQQLYKELKPKTLSGFKQAMLMFIRKNVDVIEVGE